MNFFNAFHILPDAFGIDISDNSLKFVHLAKHQDEYEVMAFGERLYGKDVIEKGRVLDTARLAEEIKGALEGQRRHGGLPPYAIVGFPEEEVFIRVLQMPKMDSEELARAIRWEIEGNIPLSIESVYYSYQAIGPSAAELDHIDVLVAAASKDVVDGYVNACALSGVQALAVEPTSAALVRALVPAEKASQETVLLDLGARHTRIVIYAQGALRLTSSVSLSLEDFITSSMKALACTREEAERQLYTHGLSKAAQEGKLFEAVVPILTDLKEQVEKYMNFEKTHREHEHGEKNTSLPPVVLMGGGALIPGIEEYFSEMFASPVRLADPWINIPVRHKGELPHIPYRDALRFTPAIGLALRGVLPPQSLDENNFFAP